MEIVMGIHHDYKSKRGERAMAKQQKRIGRADFGVCDWEPDNQPL